jgi:hypothetical protein
MTGNLTLQEGRSMLSMRAKGEEEAAMAVAAQEARIKVERMGILNKGQRNVGLN